MYKIKLLLVGLLVVAAIVCGLWTANWTYVWFSDPAPMAAAEVAMLLATVAFGLVLVLAACWMKDLLSERPKRSSREEFLSDPNREWNADV